MSNFSDLKVVPVNYSRYSIFSLLCSYWDICEELIAMKELINIDNIRTFILQMYICSDGLRNIQRALREKWVLSLLPLYMVLLKYSKHNFVCNPNRFEKREYFYFLMGKKHRLERELQRMEIINERSNRNTVARRGCLRV